MRVILLFLLLAVVAPSTVAAQEYYECVVTSNGSRGGVCAQYQGRAHMCQLYDGYSGAGTPSHCSKFCLNRSGIPEECATVSVRPSTNPEAHRQKKNIEDQIGIDLGALKGMEGEIRNRLGNIEDEINTKDGVDSGEVQYVVGRVISVIRDILGEKVTGFFKKDPDDEDTESMDEEYDELTEEDFMDTSIEGTGFNEYRTEKWPDENGVKIGKIVGPYGGERYTSDGKHFYDNPYDAAHSGEGLSNFANGVSDAWSGFTGLFSFRGKLPDKDKELQRDIAREVLTGAKSQHAKDIEEAYEKISEKIDVPVLGDVPAKAVVEVAKEASATDFAGGALLYIEQRKEGKTLSNIRENLSEELSEGYGTFGEGVSLSTTSKQAEAVLYARYEEVYQRYLLAKEFGREE